MRNVGPGQAILAAAIVAGMFAAGRPYRTVAGLVVLAVMITPGPGGQSMAAGLIGYVTDTLKGALRQ